MKVLVKRADVVHALSAGLAALGLYGNRYWTIGRLLGATDDAYV